MVDFPHHGDQPNEPDDEPGDQPHRHDRSGGDAPRPGWNNPDWNSPDFGLDGDHDTELTQLTGRPPRQQAGIDPIPTDDDQLDEQPPAGTRERGDEAPDTDDEPQQDATTNGDGGAEPPDQPPKPPNNADQPEEPEEPDQPDEREGAAETATSDTELPEQQDSDDPNEPPTGEKLLEVAEEAGSPLEHLEAVAVKQGDTLIDVADKSSGGAYGVFTRPTGHAEVAVPHDPPPSPLHGHEADHIGSAGLVLGLALFELGRWFGRQWQRHKERKDDAGN